MAEKEFRDGYIITSGGKLYSTKGADGKRTPVATREDKDGYLRAQIGDNETVYIHKLVAKAFCEKGGGGLVLHKDGNKKNNSASNLEYGTHKENRKQREEHRKDSFSRRRWDSEQFAITEWTRTPEGYLKVLGVAAITGEMEYPREDGGVQVEEVAPEALSNSVESLIHKAVTDEHPPGGEVNANNHQALSKGMVVEARYDAEKGEQQVAVVLTDAVTIGKVERGELTMFSPGYTADIITLGDGRTRQIGRSNNHLALTAAGRAGPRAGLRPRLDSQHQIIKEDSQMPDIKEEPKEDAMEDMKKKMDSMRQDMDDLKQKNDSLQAKVDAYEAAKQEKKQDSNFVAMYNERQDALENAERAKVEVDKDWTNTEIKAAIVEKIVKKRYDSAEALNAAYEVAVSGLPTGDGGEALVRAVREGHQVKREDAKTEPPKTDPSRAHLSNYGNAFKEQE